MDVSKLGPGLDPEVIITQDSPKASEHGSDLLVEVASLTGLPVDWVQSELTQIVKGSGHAPEQLTLEELRASMLQYLEEMNREFMAQEEADHLGLLDSMSMPSDISH